MIKNPTKQAKSVLLSQEDKLLLGGSEFLTIFNPNITELSLYLFTNSTNKAFLSVDESSATYCISDGVIDDFLNNECFTSQITEDDIRIFKLMNKKYENLELKLP